jgi:GH18 family chitinase
MLTVAAPAYPEYGDSPTAEFTMLASVQAAFDQINIMTYDLSGPYEGWVTWYNSPIYDGGYTFPSVPTELVPSINGAVSNFVNNGVLPGKLGVGTPFYGYIWTGGPGVTQPRQSWPDTNPPTFSAAHLRGYSQQLLPKQPLSLGRRRASRLSQHHQYSGLQRHVHFLR